MKPVAQDDFVGFGIGLRPDHYQVIADTQPDIDWFEIISEDFMVDGGGPLYYLDRIREHYPIAMHGVSLSIGGCDPLNQDYLFNLKKLNDRVKPLWISDHLCWTGIDSINTHDLLPLPYSEEAINHVVKRIKQVQAYLGCQILLENVSSYVTFKEASLTEWDFLSAVATQADCFILLDINNIYVNAFNHGFSADEYLHSIPLDRVKQFHLAGHKNCQTHIIDTHDDAIIDPVWQLYAKAVQRFGDVATLIERDGNIPPLRELMREAQQAKSIYQQINSGIAV